MIEGAGVALACANLVAAGLMAVSNEGESGTGSECHQQLSATGRMRSDALVASPSRHRNGAQRKTRSVRQN